MESRCGDFSALCSTIVLQNKLSLPIVSPSLLFQRQRIYEETKFQWNSTRMSSIMKAMVHYTRNPDPVRFKLQNHCFCFATTPTWLGVLVMITSLATASKGTGIQARGQSPCVRKWISPSILYTEALEFERDNEETAINMISLNLLLSTTLLIAHPFNETNKRQWSSPR